MLLSFNKYETKGNCIQEQQIEACQEIKQREAKHSLLVGKMPIRFHFFVLRLYYFNLIETVLATKFLLVKEALCNSRDLSIIEACWMSLRSSGYFGSSLSFQVSHWTEVKDDFFGSVVKIPNRAEYLLRFMQRRKCLD